jgi:hypothetical protein
VKLTGTNSSIGLIALILDTRSDDGSNKDQTNAQNARGICRLAVLRRRTVLGWLGGYGEEPEPDPIPNSAVKLLSADDTSS